MVYATVIPVAGAAIVATSLGTAALGHENIKKGISNLHENVVPAVGAAAVAAATGTGHVMCKVVKDIKTIVTEAAGTEVQNWSRGDYGDPVKRWWSGEYGTPVAQWWNGDFGNPVRDWATAVTEKGKKN